MVLHDFQQENSGLILYAPIMSTTCRLSNYPILMKTIRSFIALVCCVCMVSHAYAQDWYQMHVDYNGYEWKFPVNASHVTHFDFNPDGSQLQTHLYGEDDIIVPFDLETSNKYGAKVTDMTLSDELTEWGKNKYAVFAIYVTVDDGSDITSKEEYVHCYISVDGLGEYPDNSMPAQIRGRGNSTWEWYDKKPYRIKFDESTKMLGIKKNKDWVLLANYRDVTKMMNTYAFITADWMGLPYTTPIRYAELFINGEYKGLYQIAEQVEVGGNRVAINETDGLLLTLDVDDGPEISPYSGDNFYTQVYNMPMAVKNPKNLTSDQLNKIKSDFAELENAIKAHNYTVVDSLMDIPSYIHMLQLQEYLYNVELSAPRSVFLFRDVDGKYTFGPAWDWDAGYDFEWSDMTTGHTYFQRYNETILGSDPYRRNGTYRCPKFFTDMFGSGKFVKQYKELWSAISDSLFLRNWEETEKYISGLEALQTKKDKNYTTPITRETERWPIRNFSYYTEKNKMKTWLQNRLSYINSLVMDYPEPDDEGGEVVIPDNYKFMGTISKSYELSKAGGYSQSVKVEVTARELAQVLGVNSSTVTADNLDLVPLNADGTEGSNTAAGTYGAWFDAEGNTVDFNGNSHVYLESDDPFSLKCGCHPNNCAGNDVHTVRMQYRHIPSAKAANLEVTFTIADDGWNWPWW